MKKLTPQQRREVVALSQCDEQTVRRWIKGEPMRPTSRERIERAWREVKERGKK